MVGVYYSLRMTQAAIEVQNEPTSFLLKSTKQYRRHLLLHTLDLTIEWPESFALWMQGRCSWAIAGGIIVRSVLNLASIKVISLFKVAIQNP